MELERESGLSESSKQTTRMGQDIPWGQRLKNTWHSWGGFSNSTLKVIALITMFIDHVAAAIMVRFFLDGQFLQYFSLYEVMRGIGRIAFPIYCYMLVEGLHYTRNKWKYLSRLGILALVSEIPFDLAFQSRILELTYQNVFLTLFFGLLTLILTEETEIRAKAWLADREPGIVEAVVTLISCLIALAGMVCAYICRTDYSWMGVLCICILYHTRRNKRIQLVAGYLAFCIFLGEWVAFPAFLLLALYKGKKGFSCKLLFYGFYPIHLLLLYVVCVILQIAQYSVL